MPDLDLAQLHVGCDDVSAILGMPESGAFTGDSADGDTAVAERLQRLAWWDWPLELIMQRLDDFQSADIEAFCERRDRR